MQDILARLEQMLPEGLDFLEHMVNLDSPSFDKEHVDSLGEFVGGYFSNIGGQISRTPERNRGDHLSIRFGDRTTPAVMLLGHLDTVWPAGETADRPYRVEDGIARGPGVFDMKAGIAMMWMAMRALCDRDVGLPIPVEVLLTSNEEVGSPESRELVRKAARDKRAVLVLEPSLPGGVLKTIRNGMGRFTVKAVGRAAHSGVDPGAGVNAIEEMAHQIARIAGLGDPRLSTTVSVTHIQGGTRPNMIPAECTVQVDARTPTSEEAARVTRAIHALQPVLPESRIEVDGKFRRPPLERTPQNARLFGLAREIAAELGHDLKEGATGGASDGNLTSAIGIPTLDGLGPIGNGAHHLDEHVEVDSIPWRTAIVAGLILRLADQDPRK
jgi:glutamate carboxypeptidase